MSRGLRNHEELLTKYPCSTPILVYRVTHKPTVGTKVDPIEYTSLDPSDSFSDSSSVIINLGPVFVEMFLAFGIDMKDELMRPSNVENISSSTRTYFKCFFLYKHYVTAITTFIGRHKIMDFFCRVWHYQTHNYRL